MIRDAVGGVPGLVAPAPGQAGSKRVDGEVNRPGDDRVVVRAYQHAYHDYAVPHTCGGTKREYYAWVRIRGLNIATREYKKVVRLSD